MLCPSKIFPTVRIFSFNIFLLSMKLIETAMSLWVLLPADTWKSWQLKIHTNLLQSYNVTTSPSENHKIEITSDLKKTQNKRKVYCEALKSYSDYLIYIITCIIKSSYWIMMGHGGMSVGSTVIEKWGLSIRSNTKFGCAF